MLFHRPWNTFDNLRDKRSCPPFLPPRLGPLMCLFQDSLSETS